MRDIFGSEIWDNPDKLDEYGYLTAQGGDCDKLGLIFFREAKSKNDWKYAEKIFIQMRKELVAMSKLINQIVFKRMREIDPNRNWGW